MSSPTTTPEEFINEELHDTVETIDSIIKLCWDNCRNSGITKDQLEWITLAKDTCILKVGILTNDSFLKTARKAATLSENKEQENQSKQ